MPGVGPPPKRPSERRKPRPKGSEPPRRTLKASPSAAPPLPDAVHLSERTRAWYRTWSTSPQAARFLATDWQRLGMLAALVERYFEAPTPALMAEVRISEASLGATEADRLRLRWDVADESAPTTPPDSARRR